MKLVGHLRLKNSYFSISRSISFDKIIKSNIQNFYKKLLPVDYVLKNFEEIKLEKKYSDMLKDGKLVSLSKYKNETGGTFKIKNINHNILGNVYEIKFRGIFFVLPGSFCLNDPDAALRGLANFSFKLLKSELFIKEQLKFINKA